MRCDDLLGHAQQLVLDKLNLLIYRIKLQLFGLLPITC
jgi:hypothetical protein